MYDYSIILDEMFYYNTTSDLVIQVNKVVWFVPKNNKEFCSWTSWLVVVSQATFLNMAYPVELGELLTQWKYHKSLPRYYCIVATKYTI